MKIKIDTYYDITCQNCGKSWSTDFNANTKQMTDGGMGMATSKQWLSKAAYKAGWKYKQGKTLCPECVKLKEGNNIEKEYYLESDTNLSLAIRKVECEFEAHSNFAFQQPRLIDLQAIQVACSLLQQTITESKDSELKEYAKKYLENANEKLSVMKTCSY